MRIQTNDNIMTELTIVSTSHIAIRDRIDIRYTLTETSLIGNTVLKTDTPTFSITGSIEIDNFLSVASSAELMVSQSEVKALEHSGITEWDGSTVDDITNDPSASVVKPWVIGELVAPPNILSYQGTNYDVVQPHTTQANWLPPNLPALYSVSSNQSGSSSALESWVQPLGAQDAYANGAQVTHNSLCWESTTPDNVWEPGVFGWIEITCP